MPRHYIIFWLTNNAYSLCSLLQIQIVSAHGIHLMDIPGTCVNHVLCGDHHRLLRSGENAAEHPDRAWDGCEAKVKFPIKTWMRHRHRADLWNFPFYEVIRSREILLWRRKKAPFQGMFDREKAACSAMFSGLPFHRPVWIWLSQPPEGAAGNTRLWLCPKSLGGYHYTPWQVGLWRPHVKVGHLSLIPQPTPPKMATL